MRSSILQLDRSLDESAERDVAVRDESPIAAHLRGILSELGENPRREGLQDTPARYERSMSFLTAGYAENIDAIVGKALFAHDSDEVVLVRDIEVYSLCEHHLLPFFGKAHVAYLPNGKIVGLSKIPRIVDAFARRLQVQERLTTQVAQALERILNPLGVAVVIEASHFCMMMRGVQKQNSLTTTSAMRGAFKTDPELRREFFQLLRQGQRS